MKSEKSIILWEKGIKYGGENPSILMYEVSYGF